MRCEGDHRMIKWTFQCKVKKKTDADKLFAFPIGEMSMLVFEAIVVIISSVGGSIGQSW